MVDKPGADTCGYRPTQEPAVGVDPRAVVKREGILESNDFPFHSLHFGNVRDSSSPVAKPGDMYDDIYG